MQKTNIKASILIWATFLSLIITVTFVSISTNINKSLKNNSSLTKQFKLGNQINNIINSWSINNSFTNSYLDNWDKIIFDSNNFISTSLKKWISHTGKIIENNSSITINIIEWWPVYYKNSSSSWIVINSKTFSNNNTWKFYIENLWWYSKIEISSDSTKNYLSQYLNYKIYKQIWNKEIIETKWKIKMFD